MGVRMRMAVAKLSAVLGAALFLSACASSGGTGGPAATALALPSLDGSSGDASGAGGLVAGPLGRGLDEQDRQRAHAAEMNALDNGGPGSPVGWRGDSGAYGTVIAGPAYSRPGYLKCRDYSHTIYVQGKPQAARGIACISREGGAWASVAS
ncbi:hypothetical protein V5F77_15145 [Xanthobacter sp. DSM 24535]|uniref:hypothetical protein n=1 Tax=Roseixanthobacter psychrophilus TaxID=3119917 RepID=UPI0037283784